MTTDSNICANIGQKIKELRSERGLTQAQLAEELFISRSALALYETGKREIPNVLIRIVALYFDVSTDFLFDLAD